MTDSRHPPHPGRRRQRAALLLVLLALVLTAGLLLWRSQQEPPRHWFDPAQRLPHPFTDPTTLASLRQALLHQHPQLRPDQPLFIRLSQPDCACETLVDAYHRLQTPLLTRQHYQVLTLLPADLRTLHASLPDLYTWITATPAVLVLDAQGRLAYFGPYHQHGVCNSKNSYLEPVLNAVHQGQPANVINTLVFGCFCPLAP